MNRILIITGGEVNITSSQQYIEERKYNKVIAVDGGLGTAKKIGILPHIVVGDFDTVSGELLDEYKNKGSHIIKLNPMKNDTDTEAAFVLAMEFNPQEIDILGAIGSRFDHSYANMFLLKRGYEAGVKVHIITELCRISIISGDVIIKKSELYGKYISLIQFDGNAEGVVLKDFVYMLDGFDFDTSKTYRLGVSNELEKEQGFIHIDKGFMLLIESKEDKGNDKGQ